MKPISNTAFYCCGARMHDAERECPVCGDVYAKVFMNESGLRIYEAFKDEVNCSASIVARHRIIDDFLRQALSTTSDLRVITIGAGFDSRPYRFDGGTWVELDEPQVIAYKNERLPISSCANQLHRIPIDFSSDSLEEKLSSFSKPGPVVFVIEGVFIYLDEDEIKKLLRAFHDLYPKHKLICDLVTRSLIEKYGRTLAEKIEGIGAFFKAVDNPEAAFTTNGYRVEEMMSIIDRYVDFGTFNIPKFILKYFLSTIANGNSIYVFESHY